MHKSFKPASVVGTTTLSVRLSRELVADFLAACARELGPMRIRNGDGARRVVLERLIRGYIAQQQPEATGSNRK